MTEKRFQFYIFSETFLLSYRVIFVCVHEKNPGGSFCFFVFFVFFVFCVCCHTGYLVCVIQGYLYVWWCSTYLIHLPPSIYAVKSTTSTSGRRWPSFEFTCLTSTRHIGQMGALRLAFNVSTCCFMHPIQNACLQST